MIKTLPASILVKGIGTRRHASSEYLMVDGYIDRMVNGYLVTPHIQREMHVVDNLAPGLLLGIDIITPEKISFNVLKPCLLFHSHNSMIVDIILTVQEKSKVPRVRTKKRTVVEAHTVSVVLVDVVDTGGRPDREVIFIS